MRWPAESLSSQYPARPALARHRGTDAPAAICPSLSDEATAARVLQGDPSGLSSREAALARWSRQVVLDSNAPTQADVDHLRDVGFSDREIFEATAFIAFRLAFSTIDSALGAQPDQELIERVPPLVREAVTYGRPRTE
jgi:hypothetical protein